MDEHAPTVGADQPLDRRAGAVRLQLIAALAVAHAVGLPLAVELRPALSEAEERPFRQQERHVRRLRVERQPLHRYAGGRLDMECGRLRGEAHGQVSCAHGLEGVCRPPRAHPLRRIRLRDPAVVWHRRRRPGGDWKDADADRGRTERRHDDLDGPAADRDVRRLAADDASRKRDASGCGRQVLERFAARDRSRHDVAYYPTGGFMTESTFRMGSTTEETGGFDETEETRRRRRRRQRVQHGDTKLTVTNGGCHAADCLRAGPGAGAGVGSEYRESQAHRVRAVFAILGYPGPTPPRAARRKQSRVLLTTRTSPCVSVFSVSPW